MLDWGNLPWWGFVGVPYTTRTARRRYSCPYGDGRTL